MRRASLTSRFVWLVAGTAACLSCSDKVDDKGCSLRQQSSAASLTAASETCSLVTWRLDGATGATSGNWSDNFSTGNGTVSFNFPQTVRAGESVSLIATFTASVTHNPGVGGAEILFLSVAGGLGFSQTNTSNIGTANPTASGSVIVTGSWTVPASGPGDKLTFQLQAGFQSTHGVGWGLTPVVTYSKVP